MTDTPLSDRHSAPFSDRHSFQWQTLHSVADTPHYSVTDTPLSYKTPSCRHSTKWQTLYTIQCQTLHSVTDTTLHSLTGTPLHSVTDTQLHTKYNSKRAPEAIIFDEFKTYFCNSANHLEMFGRKLTNTFGACSKMLNALAPLISPNLSKSCHLKRITSMQLPAKEDTYQSWRTGSSVIRAVSSCQG